jgi:hypothetical protein
MPFAPRGGGARSACRRGRRKLSASTTPTANGSMVFACRTRGTFTSSLALSGAREHVARKTYIRAKGYHNPSFDRAFATVQSDPLWHCHQLPCGHDVMIDLPDRLTELLLQAAA